MIDLYAIAITPLIYFISILLYIHASLKLEGKNRFVRCFGVMAIGLSIEVILGGVIALTWQSDVPDYVVPSSQRLATFIAFLGFFSVGFLLMWLDLSRQYIKLRKTAS